MAVFGETVGLILKGVHFLARQPRDWQVTALRTSLYRFFCQMVLPYLSIYVIALGATGTQLGFVNSIGMGVAALGGPSAGQVIDRIGFKKIYLIGPHYLFLTFVGLDLLIRVPLLIGMPETLGAHPKNKNRE